MKARGLTGEIRKSANKTRTQKQKAGNQETHNETITNTATDIRKSGQDVYKGTGKGKWWFGKCQSWHENGNQWGKGGKCANEGGKNSWQKGSGKKRSKGQERQGVQRGVERAATRTCTPLLKMRKNTLKKHLTMMKRCERGVSWKKVKMSSNEQWQEVISRRDQQKVKKTNQASLSIECGKQSTFERTGG